MIWYKNILIDLVDNWNKAVASSPVNQSEMLISLSVDIKPQEVDIFIKNGDLLLVAVTQRGSSESCTTVDSVNEGCKQVVSDLLMVGINDLIQKYQIKK